MKTIFALIVALFIFSGLPAPALFAQTQTSTTTPEDNFSKAMDSFQKEREGFIQAKEKFSENEKAELAQTQYLEKSQNVLLSVINVMEKRNEQLESQIQTKSVAYGTSGASLITMLNSDAQTLNGFSTEITNATSSDSLKSVAAQVRAYRVQQQSYLRKLIVLTHINQYESSALSTAENRSHQLEQKISAIKNQNLDTEDLENMLTTAKNNISQAKQDLSDVKDLVVQSTSSVVNIGDLESKLSDAQQFVKDAYQSFKQIAINGNELFVKQPDNGSLPVATSTYVPVVTSAATSTQ